MSRTLRGAAFPCGLEREPFLEALCAMPGQTVTVYACAQGGDLVQFSDNGFVYRQVRFRADGTFAFSELLTEGQPVCEGTYLECTWILPEVEGQGCLGVSRADGGTGLLDGSTDGSP